MIANVCSGKQREREVYPQQLETKYFFKLFIVHGSGQLISLY